MRTHPLRYTLVLILACLLTTLLFLLGLSTPAAHFWSRYLLPIVIVFLWGRRRDIYVVTVLASVLVFAGYWFNQPFMLDDLLINHLVPVLVLWGVAWQLARYRRLEEDLQHSKQALETQVEARTGALQEANRLLEQRVGKRTSELQEERTMLRTVVDTIPDFIYVKDRQHRMLLNNLAHVRSIDMGSGAELLGKTDLDLFPRPLALQFHADEERLFASGQPLVNLEEHSVRPDGSDAWMLTTKVPLRSLQGEITGLVGVTRDITAHKEAEAVIEAALAHEKELGELKSRLVSMASHEFRNPLAVILGTAEVLELLWEEMDKAKVDDRLHRIHEQALRLVEITDDVLRLARLQTGRSKYAPVPGDLDALVTSMVYDLSELPGNQGRIHYSCAQRPLPAIFDTHLLQQAIGNLLQNALKYSPPDQSVRVTLTRTPGQTTGQITLSITDAGIGIPVEDLPHLFEPFHRAANVGAIQGTGLGLAIVKEAVDLHGGTIAVESHVGVGTTFIVNLPEAVPAP